MLMPAYPCLTFRPLWGLCLAAVVLWGAVPALKAREIIYPEGHAIVVDITAAPWGADPTGVEDVASIIVEASEYARTRACPLILYFPNGTYRIASPVVLETETPKGQWIMLQGQSRDGVILRSDANDPDFQNAASPVPVISFFESDWTNNAFQMLFENFTVEVGAGNPGAIGVRFHGNNVARMEDVRIVSLDPSGAGAIGLDLKPRISAPGIIKDVEVEGFDIGIDIANTSSSAQGWTLENIVVRNQNVVGIQSHRKAVQILDLISVNTVPAYISQFVDGMVTIIGAELSTPGGQMVDGTAIVMNGDFLYLRDVAVTGYTTALNDNGIVVDKLGVGESYRNGPAYSLWEDSLDDFAHLPILDTPEVPWEAPELWELVDPNAQDDDTEALQAALLSGAKTVFLLPGYFNITESVRVGPNVQRIASNWARVQWSGELYASGRAIFYWEESNHDVVIMDRVATNWLKETREYMVHNATSADMVLRDCYWIGGAVYRNEPTDGRLFVEDTHNVPGGQVFRNDLPGWIIINQDSWMRQLNPEMTWPLLTVDGGNFWVSGFKFGEQQGPVVVAKNQAVVEMLGGYMNVTHGVDLEPYDVPMIDIDNAQVSIRLIERAGEREGPPNWNFRHRNIAREIRNGETRLLPTTDPSIIHRDTMSRNGPGWGGAMVPLYTSLLNPALYASNMAPAIEVAASVAATVDGGVQLLAETTDPDGPAAVPSVHWRTVSGPGAAYFSDASARATRVTVTRPGLYQFVATASDGLARTDSAPLEVEFSVAPQTLYFRGPALQRLTDLPPRDGEADNALSSIYLFAGDFSTSPSTPEQEIRLHMEADLRAWTGRADAIHRAELRLVPKSLRNPAPLDLVRTTSNDVGIVSVADFSAQSEPITQIAPASLAVGSEVVLDVTDAVKAALAGGRDAIGLQLRLSDGPDDNGASNYVEFYGANPATPQYDPKLEIEVTAPPVVTFADQIALLSDGTGYAPGMGFVTDEGNGWWDSNSLRRSFYPHPGATSSGLYLFLSGHGWTWTQPHIFPHVYSYPQATWLHAFTNESAYWFFDYTTGEWFYNAPDGSVTFP